MDDLYDEFGNFIGEEAEASEEESEHGVDAGNYVYDEYAEEAPAATGMELMEVDGRARLPFEFDVIARFRFANLIFRRRPFQRGCSPRGQAVLPDSGPSIWRRGRDTGSGGGCATTHRAYRCAG